MKKGGRQDHTKSFPLYFEEFWIKLHCKLLVNHIGNKKKTVIGLAFWHGVFLEGLVIFVCTFACCCGGNCTVVRGLLTIWGLKTEWLLSQSNNGEYTDPSEKKIVVVGLLVYRIEDFVSTQEKNPLFLHYFFCLYDTACSFRKNIII